MAVSRVVILSAGRDAQHHNSCVIDVNLDNLATSNYRQIIARYVRCVESGIDLLTGDFEKRHKIYQFSKWNGYKFIDPRE